MSQDEYVFEDHWESQERCYEERSYNLNYNSFTPNPLHYFTEVNYTLIGEMGDAFKLDIDGDIMWIPSKLLKSWTDNTVYTYRFL